MKQIMVPTDFSPRSDRALRRAILLAGQSGAALTLVHVVDDDQPLHLVDRQADAAAGLLCRMASTIVDMDHIPTETVLACGDPFCGILRAAEDRDPDLIVMGPHRRQFLDSFAGTTAERTIRRSARPVLMANAVPAAPYRRSLLAMDLDHASRSALCAAGRLGILDRTDMIALHLFDAPALSLMHRAIQTPEAIEAYVSAERQAVRLAFAQLLAESSLRPARHLIEPLRGSPAASILGFAEDQGADLILVGTTARNGLKRLLIGSVAQQVLLEADRDVLVVPAAGDA